MVIITVFTVAFATALVTDDIAKEECVDNVDFKYQGSVKRNCAWAAMQQNKRCAYSAVAENCKKTCGVCNKKVEDIKVDEVIEVTVTDAETKSATTTEPAPQDDMNWNVTARKNGKGIRGCSWVAEKPYFRCQKIGSDGNPAYKACIVTCENYDCEGNPNKPCVKKTTPAPTETPEEEKSEDDPKVESTTAAATETTTASETEEPVDPCADDMSWRAINAKGTAIKSRTCDWVAIKPVVRCHVTGLSKDKTIVAKDGCKESCGTPCAPPTTPAPIVTDAPNTTTTTEAPPECKDDDTWVKAGTKNKDCNWVNKTWDLKKLTNKRCNKQNDMYGENGVHAYDACHLTCTRFLPEPCVPPAPTTPKPVPSCNAEENFRAAADSILKSKELSLNYGCAEVLGDIDSASKEAICMCLNAAKHFGQNSDEIEKGLNADCLFDKDYTLSDYTQGICSEEFPAPLKKFYSSLDSCTIQTNWHMPGARFKTCHWFKQKPNKRCKQLKGDNALRCGSICYQPCAARDDILALP